MPPLTMACAVCASGTGAVFARFACEVGHDFECCSAACAKDFERRCREASKRCVQARKRWEEKRKRLYVDVLQKAKRLVEGLACPAARADALSKYIPVCAHCVVLETTPPTPPVDAKQPPPEAVAEDGKAEPASRLEGLRFLHELVAFRKDVDVEVGAVRKLRRNARKAKPDAKARVFAVPPDDGAAARGYPVEDPPWLSPDYAWEDSEEAMPEACVRAPPPPMPPPPRLQPHWSATWSQDWQRYYFVDRITGRSQWEEPPDCGGRYLCREHVLAVDFQAVRGDLLEVLHLEESGYCHVQHVAPPFACGRLPTSALQEAPPARFWKVMQRFVVCEAYAAPNFVSGYLSAERGEEVTVLSPFSETGWAFVRVGGRAPREGWLPACAFSDAGALRFG